MITMRKLVTDRKGPINHSPSTQSHSHKPPLTIVIPLHLQVNLCTELYVQVLVTYWIQQEVLGGPSYDPKWCGSIL
jgi:hypothetical protein